jgi:hypothetical protein
MRREHLRGYLAAESNRRRELRLQAMRLRRLRLETADPEAPEGTGELRLES